MWLSTVEHKALKHSSANFVVYLIDGTDPLFMIGRKQLWRLLENNWQNGQRWRVVQGGQYQDWMTLIPAHEFMALCSLI
jgi:hypothetical protein